MNNNPSREPFFRPVRAYFCQKLPFSPNFKKFDREFSIKIPLLNTSSCYFTSDVFSFQIVLEPGQEYFLMYDFGQGRHLFMGEDVRLQNEIMKAGLHWHFPDKERNDTDYVAFLAESNKRLEDGIRTLDSIVTVNPNLSKRFYTYSKGELLAEQAFQLGQTVFNDNWTLSDNINEYVYEKYWKNTLKPYTLHRSINTFVHDFMLSQNNKYPDMVFNIADCMNKCIQNDEDRAAIDEYSTKYLELTAVIEAIDTSDKERITNTVEEFNETNKDLIKRIIELKDYSVNLSRQKREINQDIRILDSLGTDEIVKEIFLSHYFSKQLDWLHRPFPQEIADTLNKLIHNPIFLDKIIEKNKVYVALENGTFDSEAFNTNNIDLNGVSEGKELLDKLLEPHKGKVVLLDIWGTWCRPCKERLSHSAEEYAALADYDVVYLYLANNSPEQSWKNIIREYNVKGDNVFHYNLPSEQQSAIENYLNAHSYPTYKLFDTKGNLVPVDVNVWDLEGLKELVRKISNNK